MPDPTARADSRAVLIAVSAYQDPEFPPIRAARNSLGAMRALLTDPELGGWPPERITVIANPQSPVDLAERLADLAEQTTGVLLVYYVGHGVLTPRGELCLTVASTRRNRSKITGLAWESITEILHTSNCPARVRVAILDCCFAGQAISEALVGGQDEAVADATHAEGVYTLTATTRNRTAHVPPAERQDDLCTSFTGELRDLVREGLPGRPEWLTLGELYPVLRHRLKTKGLPLPNQRGTDTADRFLFTANAAHPSRSPRLHTAPLSGVTAAASVVPDDLDRPLAFAKIAHTQKAASPDRLGHLPRAAAHATARTDPHHGAKRGSNLSQSPASPGPARRPVTRAQPPRGREASRLFDQAEHAARQVSDTSSRANALIEVARAAVASDPERTQRLLKDAEHTIANISDREAKRKGYVLAALAKAATVVDPEHSRRIITRINDEDVKRFALTQVIEALGNTDPERTGRLLDQAERAARKVVQASWRAQALIKLARATVASDPERTQQLLKDAEHTIANISNKDASGKGYALAALAEAATTLAPDHAGKLWDQVERAAKSITYVSQRESLLARLAVGIAVSDPDRGERAVAGIGVGRGGDRARALIGIGKAVAVADPGRAKRLWDEAEEAMLSIDDAPERTRVLLELAQTAAPTDPERTRRLQEEAYVAATSDAKIRSKDIALAGLVQSLVADHPGRAARIAADIRDPFAKARALTCLAVA